MNEVTQSCIVPPNSEREKALDSTRSLDGKNDARAGERVNVWRRRDFFDFARAEPIILDDRLKREWLRPLSDCLPSANDMLGSGREGIR